MRTRSKLSLKTGGADIDRAEGQGEGGADTDRADLSGNKTPVAGVRDHISHMMTITNMIGHGVV